MSDSLKQRLLDHCSLYILQKLETIRLAIASAQESANDDTKSSAGDKHETGRAMAQLEQEKLSGQLAENLKQQTILKSINAKTTSNVIGLGSIVITTKGNYFIAISAGRVEIDKESYFLISTASPIGTALINTKSEAKFKFNNEEISIKKVL